MNIIVASTNPVKIEAAREGFRRMFPAEAFTFESINIPSGVSHQSMSSIEVAPASSYPMLSSRLSATAVSP